MAQLRYSPLSNPSNLAGNRHFPGQTPRFPSVSLLPSPSNSSTASSNRSLSLLQTRASNPTGIQNFPAKTELYGSGGDSGPGNGRGGNGGDGGGGKGDGSNFEDSSDGSSSSFGILGLFLSGWRSRVQADSQFPFKVLMEEVVGVSSCVLGDMASRPNFGLNELDFVFSTLVVGSILNFVLMYMLAPTMSSSASQNLPSIFASCPKSHMFEPGSFGIFDRFGTFVYKGVLFATVGFAAGLVGTAISNGLIKMRTKMDPEFKTPNKPPPTLLNALTWAIHMGLSSNFRYQTLNGVEYVMAKNLPPLGFKMSVVVLRCLNNILGGVSFVLLARLTGSQKVVATETASGEEKGKLIEGDEDLHRSQASCK